MCVLAALLVSDAAAKADALIDAVMEGDEDALVRLIDAGLNVNMALPANRAGPFTALTIAIAQANLRLVPVLLAAGAFPTASALLAACGGISMHRDFFSLQGGQHELPDVGVVKQLLNAGADPNPPYLVDKSGGPWGSPLVQASLRGHLSSVEALLAAGAHPGTQAPDSGVTALAFAAWKGHTNVVSALLQAGADASHKDFDGLTARDKARAGKKQPSPYATPSSTNRVGSPAEYDATISLLRKAERSSTARRTPSETTDPKLAAALPAVLLGVAVVAVSCWRAGRDLQAVRPAPDERRRRPPAARRARRE